MKNPLRSACSSRPTCRAGIIAATARHRRECAGANMGALSEVCAAREPAFWDGSGAVTSASLVVSVGGSSDASCDQLSWLNMSLPLAVFSGRGCRTSQCSMICPSSLKRKMSTPAVFELL
jgi:hypothetical protein